MNAIVVLLKPRNKTQSINRKLAFLKMYTVCGLSVSVLINTVHYSTNNTYFSRYINSV